MRYKIKFSFKQELINMYIAILLHSQCSPFCKYPKGQKCLHDKVAAYFSMSADYVYFHHIQYRHHVFLLYNVSFTLVFCVQYSLKLDEFYQFLTDANN